jgi:hypothetical protein
LLFDRAAQFHAAAAFGALKNRDCLFHPFFKFRFSTRLHINLRDFGDHDRSLFVSIVGNLAATRRSSGDTPLGRAGVAGTVHHDADNTNARAGLHCAAGAR